MAMGRVKTRPRLKLGPYGTGKNPVKRVPGRVWTRSNGFLPGLGRILFHNTAAADFQLLPDFFFQPQPPPPHVAPQPPHAASSPTPQPPHVAPPHGPSGHAGARSEQSQKILPRRFGANISDTRKKPENPDLMFIQGDDAGSPGPTGKKKRGQHAAGGDKSGRGLRQFSMKEEEDKLEDCNIGVDT
ncbi:hypothetical protein ACS0TY_021055 [Phlomoides rotata]